MYNLTNSPSGPLGQAGMSNASTRPEGLFANGPATFNNFGRGLSNFTGSLGDKASGLFSRMFGGLFGGEGNIAPAAPMAPNMAPPMIPGGAPSLFGRPGVSGNRPLGGGSMPQPNAAGSPMSQAMSSNAGQAGAPGGGFLSRFMSGGN
jgi:hypothetical protein